MSHIVWPQLNTLFVSVIKWLTSGKGRNQTQVRGAPNAIPPAVPLKSQLPIHLLSSPLRCVFTFRDIFGNIMWRGGKVGKQIMVSGWIKSRLLSAASLLQITLSSAFLQWITPLSIIIIIIYICMAESKIISKNIEGSCFAGSKTNRLSLSWYPLP